jgi:hypothetical protein
MHPPSDAAHDFWSRYSQGLYAMPRAWAHKGENLIHAFEAVASASVDGSMHFNMCDQALMLAGMAIEVQLKAILVNVPEVRSIVTAATQPADASGKRLWNTFRSHRLVDLAAEANVPLTPQQVRTAAALTQYIYWRGRYVVPTERGINDLIPIRHEDGLVGPSERSATIEAVSDLIRHVIAEVKARLYS